MKKFIIFFKKMLNKNENKDKISNIIINNNYKFIR